MSVIKIIVKFVFSVFLCVGMLSCGGKPSHGDVSGVSSFTRRTPINGDYEKKIESSDNPIREKEDEINKLEQELINFQDALEARDDEKIVNFFKNDIIVLLQNILSEKDTIKNILDLLKTVDFSENLEDNVKYILSIHVTATLSGNIKDNVEYILNILESTNLSENTKDTAKNIFNLLKTANFSENLKGNVENILKLLETDNLSEEIKDTIKNILDLFWTVNLSESLDEIIKILREISEVFQIIYEKNSDLRKKFFVVETILHVLSYKLVPIAQEFINGKPYADKPAATTIKMSDSLEGRAFSNEDYYKGVTVLNEFKEKVKNKKILIASMNRILGKIFLEVQKYLENLMTPECKCKHEEFLKNLKSNANMFVGVLIMIGVFTSDDVKTLHGEDKLQELITNANVLKIISKLSAVFQLIYEHKDSATLKSWVTGESLLYLMAYRIVPIASEIWWIIQKAFQQIEDEEYE